MSECLSLIELFALPEQDAENYILQLPALELASLRSNLEVFIRNTSANILGRVSHDAFQNERHHLGHSTSNPLRPVESNNINNVIKVSDTDNSFIDAKQMLLEAQTCIIEHLDKLRSAMHEEFALSQIEDLLRSTLKLSDCFDMNCSQELVDNTVLIDMLSESLQLRMNISNIEPPVHCSVIFSRLKHSVDTLYDAILSRAETAHLSNLVCLKSSQSREIFNILLHYNEAQAVVCRNFTTPLLQKLSCHSPLKLLENVSALISRLNTGNEESWLECLHQKFGMESEHMVCVYSNTFHQCLTIPLINFLETQSNPKIATLSYFQSLQYLRCMHIIYSSAAVRPWPGLKSAFLLEKKVEDSISDAFEAILLPLRDLNMNPVDADVIVSHFPDRFCQVFNLFLRPPVEILSENSEIPCGYFIPALADTVLNSLSSTLRRLATQLSIYNKEAFYKPLIEKLTEMLTGYSKNLVMAQGVLEFLNALPVLKGPESVPQIQDLYFLTLKEYIDIFINWLYAVSSLH